MSRLVDAFIALLAYGVEFRQHTAQEAPAYDTVRQAVLTHLQDAEASVNVVDRPDFDEARYAVCAWWDELVLATAWPHKARWRGELLQHQFYRTTDGGHRFYQRLERLAPQQKDVREIFYLCLALGFRGRYFGSENTVAWNALKCDQLKRLFGDCADTPTIAAAEKQPLFPSAYSDQPAAPPAKRAPRLAWPGILLVAPSLTFLFLFAVYRFTLHGLGQNILRAIR